MNHDDSFADLPQMIRDQIRRGYLTYLRHEHNRLRRVADEAEDRGDFDTASRIDGLVFQLKARIRRGERWEPSF